MDIFSSAPHRTEIGPHIVLSERGTCQILFGPRVSLGEAQQIVDAVLQAGDRFGKLGVLVDINRLVDFDAGARALFARPPRPYPFHIVAYVGGNFAARMLILTMVRAGKLISPKSFAFDVVGCATWEEAETLVETALATFPRSV